MFAGEANYVPAISLRNSPPVTKMGGGFSMRKSLTYKILAAVMALSAANWAVPADVSAGYEENGNYYVTDDYETISNSNDYYNNVYGNGFSFTINDGVIENDVYGVGKEGYTEDASGGNVTINGNAEVTDTVYGGRSTDGNAHHNTVNISDGSVDGSLVDVYGGRSASRTAHHNTVNIRGGSVSSVYGGRSTDGTAHHNTVNISGGSVTGNVRGGRSNSGAHHNTVNISGGTIGSDQWSVNVYGGYASGSAKDNQIIIRGSADITNANLYGRNDSASGTGNTLTIDGWRGSTQSVQNFNDIAFKNISWNDGGKILILSLIHI